VAKIAEDDQPVGVGRTEHREQPLTTLGGVVREFDAALVAESRFDTGVLVGD